MGTHSEQLQELVEAQKKYEELKALSETCFEVFETCAGITMEFIEKCINNEWVELYRKIDLYGMKDVWKEFSLMKEGIINRREFKERMSVTVSEINEFIAKLKVKFEKAEKDFLQEYNSFFVLNATSHQNRESKYIFFGLSQSDVRDIIMEFLES